MDILTSRHFVQGDLTMENFNWNGMDFDFQKMGWWSRIYEYEWVKNACASYFKDTSNGSVIDIATGDRHPMMFILKKLGFSKVVGTDIVALKDMKYSSFINDGIEYVQDDILNTNIHDKFDCVICISVLEHLNPLSQKVALENMVKMVNDGGCILLTFDIPGYEGYTDINLYENILSAHGFYFKKETPENGIIVTTMNSPIAAPVLQRMNLSCYRLFASRNRL